MSRWFREPLLHFAVLGAVIFGLYAVAGIRRDGAAPSREIVVTEGRIRSIADTFSRLWGRPPSPDEIAGLVRDFVREEALAREAMLLGLDRDDTIVRRRLAQKMEFISDDVMAVPVPTEDDLRSYLSAHADLFRVEARFTFEQILIDPGKRGRRLDDEARKLVAALNASDPLPPLEMLGDGHMLETRFQDIGLREVDTRFGRAFAERLQTLPVGRFEWPVESGYGVHLVRVERRTSAYVPPLDAVRDAVAREWSEAKRAELKDARLEALLARYRVTIAPVEPDRMAGAR